MNKKQYFIGILALTFLLLTGCNNPASKERKREYALKEIQNELADLKEQYSKRNVAEKITDVITSSKKSKPKLSPIHRLARFVSRNIIAKMSKKVQSILDLSDSLDTLTSINENVDELIAMKVPYGETKANYEKLTNYLYRANRIHSQINKKMQSL